VTQNPDDIPEDILGQLGNRVQHALRAFTARDQKALKQASETYRPNPRFETEEAIREVGVGEAVTSMLEAKGAPGIVERTLIRPPSSQLGPITAAERKAVMSASPLELKYTEPKDRESAFEMLRSRADEAAREAEAAEAREAELEAQAKAIFDKWDLDFAIVGETLAEDRFVIEHKGEVVADLPLSKLSSTAPEYDRPHVPTPPAAPFEETIEIGAIDALKALISSPNYARKQWVWQQYDSQVMADTVQPPGAGAGIVRVHGTEKMLAFTSDVTPRYVKANPVEGGKQAVAEAFRNLCAVGAKPLATTDNLNFGNPEKPQIMGQLVGAIQGIGAACSVLDTPIVSGNVSLYNETDGEPILPTPTIGAVGLIAGPDELIAGFAQEGDFVLVIGETTGHLGQSALLAEAQGLETGDAPSVDLEAERRNGDFLRTHGSMVHAASDLSDGGLALAAFEMAEAAGIGVTLEDSDIAQLFGEDQGRYVVACGFDQAEALMTAAAQAGVAIAQVGRFGGDAVTLGDDTAPLGALSTLFQQSFAKALG
jgi:phosphoribosylformylglycinamidine synthase